MFEHVHSKIVPSTKTPNTQIEIAKVKYLSPIIRQNWISYSIEKFNSDYLIN